jgi:hypothetical protein
MRAFVAACAVMPLLLAACGQGSPPTASEQASAPVEARQLSQAPGKPSADGAIKAKATAAPAAGEAPLLSSGAATGLAEAGETREIEGASMDGLSKKWVNPKAGALM